MKKFCSKLTRQELFNNDARGQLRSTSRAVIHQSSSQVYLDDI